MCSGAINMNMVILRLVIDRNHSFGAEHFNTLIVFIDSLAAIVYHSERAVFKGQRHRRSVLASDFCEHWVDKNIRSGINLFNVRAHEVARHIEIMNRHVQKTPVRKSVDSFP
jgi:hypothetical protein